MTISAGYGQNSQGTPFYSEFGQVEKLVQMYPNPASDFLAVKFQTPDAENAQLAMHSVIGNNIPVERELVDAYEVRLRVKELPAGYYFLSIKEERSGLKATYKFLKR